MSFYESIRKQYRRCCYDYSQFSAKSQEDYRQQPKNEDTRYFSMEGGFKALPEHFAEHLCQEPLDNPREIDYSRKRDPDNDFVNYPSRTIRRRRLRASREQRVIYTLPAGRMEILRHPLH